jgi:MAF protein
VLTLDKVMSMNSLPEKVYLASSSPRRQELLSQIGIAFELLVPDIDESKHDDESPYQYVCRMAYEKARAAQEKWQVGVNFPYLPMIAADTTVVIHNESVSEVLAKPDSKDHAIAMLSQLSNNTHQVYSAVCLCYKNNENELSYATKVSTTNVTFAPISEAEMQRYWQSQEPLGKAGGYAIQGLGAQFVRHIEGSYTGVVGLPLFELKQLFVEHL